MSIENLLDETIQRINHKNTVNNDKTGLFLHACNKVKGFFHKIPKESLSIEIDDFLPKNIKQSLCELKKQTSHQVVLAKLNEIIASLAENKIPEQKETADNLRNILEDLTFKLINETYLHQIINLLNDENINPKLTNLIKEIFSSEKSHDLKRDELISNIEFYLNTRLDTMAEKFKSLEATLFKLVEKIKNTFPIAEILNKTLLKEILVSNLVQLNQQLDAIKTLTTDNTLCHRNVSVQVPSFN